MRPEDPRAGETVPKTAPPDTASPRSPRSPFRFGQKKSESASGPQVLQVTEVLQQQQQHQIQQSSPDETYHQSLTSPTQQTYRRDQSPAQQQRGRRHQRQDETKSSKSGFFHFGKSAAKSSDRLNRYPSAERGEAMSRDSDHPTLTKQSTKHSGMKGWPPLILRRRCLDLC